MWGLMSSVKDNFFFVKNLLYRKGFWQTFRYVSGIFLSPSSGRFLFRCLFTSCHNKELRRILAENIGKPIIICLHRYGWSTEVVGRFQHIAMQFARKGFLYFFSVRYDDRVNGFKKIRDNLYLTNRADLLMEIERRKTIHTYSLLYNLPLDTMKGFQRKGDIILYEYIDEIHQDLSGSIIPDGILQKHNYILQDEDIIVIVTADRLYKEVASKRRRNFYLSTNGVCVEDFQVGRDLNAVPKGINSLLKKGKPIVGYYGALAKWFDYGLVKYLSNKRPDYEILLIGPKHDDSLSNAGLQRHSNITVLPPVQYKDLPYYATWFDVSIIPFVLNELTESISPVKLFEYMALGHPIVSTAMPECSKYQSVLIGNTASDFINKVDKALTMKGDEEYRKILFKEARENSWENKAEVIVQALHEHERFKT